MFNWFKRKKSIKGKYIIIHYVDVGNLENEVVDMSDRNDILNQTSQYVEQTIEPEKGLSPVDTYLDKIRKRYSIMNNYRDIAMEIYMPTRGKTETKILKFD
jgi:hypothetical protein